MRATEFVVYWGMTLEQQKAYDAGFEGTAEREEIAPNFLRFFDEGVADERALAQAEAADWHQQTSGYGWDDA